MSETSVRSTSAGLSRPGWRWSRSACPTDSWIASGAAAISVATAAGMSSMPAMNEVSPKQPWSTATSKQRREPGWKRRLSRYAFTGALLDGVLAARHTSPPRAGRALPMLIAGPNLTIDRTLSGDELRPGAVLRFDASVTPGGKGLNVARG